MGAKRKKSRLSTGNMPEAAGNEIVGPGAVSGHGDRPPRRESPWGSLLALGLIAVAAIAAYCNSLEGPFLFDDRNWITENSCIRRLWPIWEVLFPPFGTLVRGRPMLSLTLALNYALGGLNVWGYHVTNIAIHLLAAWTLFGITRRTLILPIFREQFAKMATPLALVVAAMWMIHPLQTEAVTYIVQRTESLAGLFYLLTLYCVIRGATSTKATPWYVAAATACLLGIATKEILATAPLVVLLYDRAFLAGSFRDAWRQRRGLYLGLAASWALVAILLLSTGFYAGTTGFAVQKFTCWSYLLTQSGVIARYLQLAFWPVGLCLDYNWPPAQTFSEIVVPGLVVLGLLGLTFWALVKRPVWGFLGAWFFAILAPTSSFIPIQDAAFEHRMYLSLAALAAGLVIGGWLAGQSLVRRGTISPSTLPLAGGFLAILVVVALGIATFQRNADYQSDLAIWADTAAKSPRSARAHNNLGEAYHDRHRPNDAIAQLETALEIDPKYADAQSNLGAVLANHGRPEEAIAHFQKAMELDPRSAPSYFNLGNILFSRGQIDESIELFEKALLLRPQFAPAHVGLGQALEHRGRHDEALVHYRQALALAPECLEAHNNLGMALASRGMLDEAVAHFRMAIKIRPDCAQAHSNLGLALACSRQFDEAIAECQRALQIMPDYADAYNNLGMTLAECGRIDEAIAVYQKALQLRPDFAPAYNTLGMILMKSGKRDEAVRHFRKAVEIDPNFAQARHNLEDALGHEGRKE
jgi:protein O-mannosyl-transferase